VTEQNRPEVFDGASAAIVPVAHASIVSTAQRPAGSHRGRGAGSAMVPMRQALARASGGPLPEYVRATEVHAALDLLTDDKPTERAFVRLLFELGPRISEALAARVADLDFGAKTLRLATLKRRKRHARALPVSPGLLGELAVLINKRQLSLDDRLFRWSRSRGFEITRDALVAVGVERKRANARALRHGHAVHALLSGVPLNIVQEALGHASAVTTSIYTRVIGRDIADYYAEVEW